MAKGKVHARDIRDFVGDALVAIGGLIAVLCGGCTLIFSGIFGLSTASMVLQGHASGDSWAYLGMFWVLVGVTGVLPTLLGVGLIFLGRRLRGPKLDVDSKPPLQLP